jgi:GNAT superfamily N-acetyltransferase
MPPVRIQTATLLHADDIAAVMNDCGDARGCWCAFWGRPRKEFDAGLGDGGNQRWFMQRLAETPQPIGVLAYVGGEPAGWCAVAPRSDHLRLARARTLAAVDDTPVWSVTCFVIAKRFRRQGLMRRLLDGAVALAQEHGAPCVEAYPVDPTRKMGSGELYTGLLSVFEAAGFSEVARRSPSRPVVRLALHNRRRNHEGKS